jgi:hypothetical protein
VSRSELSRARLQACLPACLPARHLTRELGAKTTPRRFRTAHLLEREPHSEESKRRPILSRWIDDDDRAPGPSDRPRLTTTTKMVGTVLRLTRTTIPT